MSKLLSVLVLLIPLKLFAQKDSVDIWISKINNRSVAGTCHYAWVLEPTVKEVSKLIKFGKPAEKKLLRLVTDEKKGVIAHYILSNIYKQTNYQTLAMDIVSAEIVYNYNGLEFIERSYGMVADHLNLERCKREWIKKIDE